MEMLLQEVEERETQRLFCKVRSAASRSPSIGGPRANSLTRGGARLRSASEPQSPAQHRPVAPPISSHHCNVAPNTLRLEARRDLSSEHVLWGGSNPSDRDSSRSQTSGSTTRQSLPLALVPSRELHVAFTSSSGSRAESKAGTGSIAGSEYSSYGEDRIVSDSESDVPRERIPIKLSESPKEELDRLLQQVPFDPQDKLTSLGSILHEGNACVPCWFHMRPKGCPNGVLCDFCHMPHEKDKPKKTASQRAARVRPRGKGQLLRYRRHVDRLKETLDRNPHAYNPETVELPPSIIKDPRLKEKVVNTLKAHQAERLALHAADEWHRQEQSYQQGYLAGLRVGVSSRLSL